MVHNIFSSTALLTALFVLSSGDVMAAKEPTSLEVPALKVSGNSSFNAWFFNNDQKMLRTGEKDNNDKTAKITDPCKLQRYGDGHLFSVDDARIKFNVDGKLDTGMEYGLAIVLDGTVGASKAVRENYLYFGGSWGKIVVGDTGGGVLNTMAFGGYDYWGGTGFINGGDFDRVVNYTTGVFHSVNLVGDSSRDTKFTYFTPRWCGLQFGITYVPRTEHRGEDKVNSILSTVTPKAPFDTDNISNGINFIHKFESGLEIALSATSVFAFRTHRETSNRVANANEAVFPRQREKTFAYCFGGDIDYGNIGFGFEYGNNGRSREIKWFKGKKSNAGQFVDFGLAYTWGATKFSTGLYYSWRKSLGAVQVGNDYIAKTKKATLLAATVAVDQKLAPGLSFYMEYGYFNMNNPNARAEATLLNLNSPCGDFYGKVPSNTANVVVIGSRLAF